MWPNVEFRDELPKKNMDLAKSHLQRKIHGYAQKTAPNTIIGHSGQFSYYFLGNQTEFSTQFFYNSPSD